MEEQPKTKRIGVVLLAIILWIVTFGMGLETIYNIKELYFLMSVTLFGVSPDQAEVAALSTVYILGIAYLIFIIATTEYHRKHVGRPESWRLFGWTLAVEVSIYLLYLLL